MQSFALTAADKQLIKTFLITFIAVVAGLPVASAIMPGRQDALAASPASSVTTTATDATDACSTGTGSGAAKSASTKSTHDVVTTTRTINTSSNNGGATAQANDHSIAAAVKVGDVLSNNDVLSHNSIPVLSNNNVNVGDVSVPVLNSTNSGTGNGGLLGVGILGL